MSKQRLIQKSQLKVTPQQIQFLNLLQTPLVSIDRIIEKELENNPALEEDYEIENEDEKKVFFSSRSSNPEFSTINIEEKKSSLKDYLELQLSTLDVSEEVKFLISYLINSLNEHGFLSENPYAISSDLLINNELDVSVDKIKQAITYLQQFDPCGIGAYDLQNCLLIQLKKKHPKNVTAYKIIKEFYSEFTNKNFEKIISKLEISKSVLKNIYKLIESLNPLPSNGFSTNNVASEYIKADFTIVNRNSKLDLVLNSHESKPLKINSYYSKLLEETTDKKTKVFLREKIEKALWFRDSLVQRSKTLKKIMSAIIKVQYNFFISGKEKDLLPMRLVDVAQKVNMDISTISRFSNAKYIETSFGTFKVKDLFSDAYRKDNGNVISTNEVKSSLKKIIDSEDKTKPFTDEELAEILGSNEYHIARRTVAKYRETMNIAVARIRREL